MTSPYTRREYLGHAGVLVGVFASGIGTAAASGSAVVPREHSNADDRLDELREKHRRLVEQIHQLEQEIEDVRHRTWEDRARYPSSIREQAQQIGLSARDSVVLIEITDHPDPDQVLGSTGTGWFVDDGYIMTNAHNVDFVGPDEMIRGWTPDGEYFTCEIVDFETDHQPDIAVLSTDHSGIPLATGDAASLHPGDHLVQVGHPGGAGYWIITLGEVSNAGGRSIEATVPGLSGVSGSPVFSLAGDVVGVTYGGSVPDETLPDGTIADPTVHTEPLAPAPGSLHVRIEDAMAKLEAWT